MPFSRFPLREHVLLLHFPRGFQDAFLRITWYMRDISCHSFHRHHSRIKWVPEALASSHFFVFEVLCDTLISHKHSITAEDNSSMLPCVACLILSWVSTSRPSNTKSHRICSLSLSLHLSFKVLRLYPAIWLVCCEESQWQSTGMQRAESWLTMLHTWNLEEISM